MRTRTILAATLGFILMAASALSALAAPVTFRFSYANGAAHANGTVTFESTLLPNPGGSFFALPNPAVLDIQMDVSGAAAGNGHFTTGNFTGVLWSTGGGTLNLAAPLVGQATPGGPWGIASGDLNFFGAAPTPNGVFPFALGANGGASTTMTLVFATPFSQVPTLSEWAMLVLAVLLAAGGMVAMRRRRA